MTWIKICGITNLEDAQAAVDAGADALGFVFYEKSPRKVAVETAREIIAQLPDNVEKVGVFAGEATQRWHETADRSDLTAVQIYVQDLLSAGSTGEVIAHTSASPRKVYLAIPAAWIIEGKFHTYFRAPLDAVFLDSGNGQQYGGTGISFDWAAAGPAVDQLRQRANFVIAGGLNIGNVVTAMRALNPFGVDVASGVEASPGKKDPGKVRAFIHAVRAEDKLT